MLFMHWLNASVTQCESEAETQRQSSVTQTRESERREIQILILRAVRRAAGGLRVIVIIAAVWRGPSGVCPSAALLYKDNGGLI